MAAPRSTACSAWATQDDLCPPCDTPADFPNVDLDEMLQVATDILFRLSGRQFPGQCQTTVRPCGRRTRNDSRPATLSGEPTARVDCRCNQERSCGGSSVSELTLGGYPLVSVDTVKVRETSGGDLLTLVEGTDYRIDDYRWLVRLPDPDGTENHWPCSQAITSAEGDGDVFFEVTFTYGQDPPQSGVHAAAVLACELAKACDPSSGAECRLPRGVQEVTREGVSFLISDPDRFFAEGLTGVYEADLFLRSTNPNGIRARATVLSSTKRRRVRRAGT